MARPVRIEFPGAIYHAYARRIGSWKQQREKLFRDHRDYRRFLDRIGDGVDKFGVRLFLCTLMSNHLHLVLETPRGNLSRFMQSLLTAYTVYYNLRHDRHGHLFDGRYKAKLVSGDEYLLNLTRYVHLNPAWVGGWENRPIKERIKHLRDYRWSSFRGYAGLEEPFEFVDEEPILTLIGGRGKQRRQRYQRFVESGLANSDEEFQETIKASASAIGDEKFVNSVERLRRRRVDERKILEDVSFRRVVEPLEPGEVLPIVAAGLAVGIDAFRERRRNSPLRAVASYYLIRYSGLTQREVAEWLNIGSGASVSAQVQRFESLKRGDQRLARQLRNIERELELRRDEQAGRGE